MNFAPVSQQAVNASITPTLSPSQPMLMYQFASSVHWIEPQDSFFEQYKFECFSYPIPNTHWQTSEPDAPIEAAIPVPTLVADPVVIVAPPLTATSGPDTSIEDVPIHAIDILAIVPNAPMPSYSWLPPWSLPNAFIQKQRVRPGFDATAQVYAQRVGISLSSGCYDSAGSSDNGSFCEALERSSGWH